MFAIPVTIRHRLPDRIITLDVTVEIDKIVLVKDLLDNPQSFGVESLDFYDQVPVCELLLEDGRKLPVLETAATVNQYLDAYRAIEDFYTRPRPASDRQVEGASDDRGVVVQLFTSRAPCPNDSSQEPTPD